VMSPGANPSCPVVREGGIGSCDAVMLLRWSIKSSQPLYNLMMPLVRRPNQDITAEQGCRIPVMRPLFPLSTRKAILAPSRPTRHLTMVII
jgi:hypothetical protein